MDYQKKLKLGTCLVLLIFCSCGQAQVESPSGSPVEIILGNQQMEQYLPLLANKKVGLIANHSSVVGERHLVDSLLSRGIEILKVFSPEHGFRGEADAGEQVKNERDKKTGLELISLYGKNKKPSAAQLKGIELLVFDIQDVGARFYTYISTLHYVMEAAAEHGIQVLVLDRPNPNGNYVDGPVLDPAYSSFVGMHPIPVVHGMTIGEYAKMINGESWLKNGVKCDLRVLACQNYTHSSSYELPIAPSPNLPNNKAIYWYPSICFFEGTAISVGRGTVKPFQQIGHPELKNYSYSFEPKPSKGAKLPKLEGQRCFGVQLDDIEQQNELNLKYLLDFYREMPDKDKYFNSFFKRLAGNDQLEKQIEKGMTEAEIRDSWKEEIAEFKRIRKQYLLYPDFE